jgi:hypothetical protein
MLKFLRKFGLKDIISKVLLREVLKLAVDECFKRDESLKVLVTSKIDDLSSKAHEKLLTEIDKI